MREIKFRAWDRYNHIMVENLQDNKFFGDMLTDDFYAVMQYTGLKDKNGKDIYEGDIVYDRNDGDEGQPYIAIKVINSHYLGHKLIPTHSYEKEFGVEINNTFDNLLGLDIDTFDSLFGNMKECEIIGNIYENPELLAN